MISYAVPTLNYLTFVVYNVNVTLKWRHSNVETASLTPIHILNVSPPRNCDVRRNDVTRLFTAKIFIFGMTINIFCIFNQN